MFAADAPGMRGASWFSILLVSGCTAETRTPDSANPGRDGTGGTGSADAWSIGSGPHFWVSPDGEGSECSEAAPCAVTRIAETTEPMPSPGETWVLKDGVYEGPFLR